MKANDRSSLAKERTREKTGRFHKGFTIGKVERDAVVMEEYSRYVIKLDDEGNVQEHYSNPPFGEIIDCIVVLAPAIFQGKRIEKSVALEIGLSRLVPFKSTEIKAVRPDRKKQCWIIKSRTQLGTLPWDVMLKIMPTLWFAIQFCIDEKLSEWKQARLIQTFDRNQKGFAVYESWMTIRVPKDQPLLYAVLRLKDELGRLEPEKNYAYLADYFQERFDEFRLLNAYYQGEYPDEVMKRSNNLYVVASQIRKNILYRGYTSRSVESIRGLLGKKDRKNVLFFDEVLRVFKVPCAPRDDFLDMYEPKLGGAKDEILSQCPLRPCRVIKRENKRTTHAQDCFTIGIIGSLDHLISLTNRNIQNRLNSDIPNDDYDVTF